ncbi:iron permease [Roridomyces roridus]|uniref:Iron permease n=1 Tax=Roridomyces roridus TaxID=1738132 RepID=A0AAD7FYN3_9AGAR|nr:iron permease [Roridomyces roridus]
MDASSLSPEPTTKSARKTRAFWLCFVAINASVFLSALDLAAVGTTLPTIAKALNDTRGTISGCVGTAYLLSSTAVIPLSGNLADVFGRKIIVLGSIAFFALGSALAGASQNMPMMIAARTIQGIGGGGILTLSEILVADLVPLAERGLYQGIVAITWAIAAYCGPSIGGALTLKGTKVWRWLFYLNLPISGIAFSLVFLYLSVNRPAGSTSEKMRRVDWTGNAIAVAGTTLAIIGLSWAGVRYRWDSAQVLAPLIVGIALLVVFAIYEAKVPIGLPTVPGDIVGNRTSLSALLSTSMHGIITMAMLYYLPVFFQACFGASTLRSAVDFLPGTLTVTPFGFGGGVAITVLKKYRAVNWVGWVFAIVGFGLFSTVRADSSVGKWVGYQIICSAGIGILFGAPMFPLLAPLPTNRAASALALFSFVRTFAQTWGLAIASTILQNRLTHKLPASFTALFPPKTEIAYAAIPVIRTLDEPLRTEVQKAFGDSMAAIWQTMIGFAGLGLLFSLLMEEVPMNTSVDENYALQEKEKDPRDNDAKAELSVEMA